MTAKKKKIVLLLAGGTCLLDSQNRILTVNDSSDIKSWLQQMPELNVLADIESVIIQGEEAEVTAITWEKIAENISLKFIEADGFIVLTKVDRLLETAVALNFMLQHFKKTIIVTAARLSGSSFIDKKELIKVWQKKYGGLNLRSNLINALQIADQPIPRPAILFGSKLLDPLLALNKVIDHSLMFYTHDEQYWGRVDFGLNIKSNLKYSPHQTKIFNKIDNKILVWQDIPGVAWNFDKKILDKYQALFIKVCPFQAVAEDKQKQIGQWKKATVIYNSQYVSSIKNAVAISQCTETTAIIKTMWAVANYSSADFSTIMMQNIIGEFNNQ